jgi:hypothetical protein
MRSRAAKLAIAIAAIASCNSCSLGFDIVPSGVATNVQLAFVEGGWFSSSSKDACITAVAVEQEKWPTRAFDALSGKSKL